MVVVASSYEVVKLDFDVSVSRQYPPKSKNATFPVFKKIYILSLWETYAKLEFQSQDVLLCLLP